MSTRLFKYLATSIIEPLHGSSTIRPINTSSTKEKFCSRGNDAVAMIPIRKKNNQTWVQNSQMTVKTRGAFYVMAAWPWHHVSKSLVKNVKHLSSTPVRRCSSIFLEIINVWGGETTHRFNSKVAESSIS